MLKPTYVQCSQYYGAVQVLQEVFGLLLSIDGGQRFYRKMSLWHLFGYYPGMVVRVVEVHKTQFLDFL